MSLVWQQPLPEIYTQLSDAELRSRLAQAGPRVVRERYSLDRMADEYEARYRQVIAARGGR